jgi:prephenate dehydrogenase
MWREILLENGAGLIAGLEDFSTMLDSMKQMILSRDAAALELFLERAKAIRQDLP